MCVYAKVMEMCSQMEPISFGLECSGVGVGDSVYVLQR